MYYIVKDKFFTIVDEQDVIYGYYMTLADAKKKLCHLLYMDHLCDERKSPQSHI